MKAIEVAIKVVTETTGKTPQQDNMKLSIDEDNERIFSDNQDALLDLELWVNGEGLEAFMREYCMLHNEFRPCKSCEA